MKQASPTPVDLTHDAPPTVFLVGCDEEVADAFREVGLLPRLYAGLERALADLPRQDVRAVVYSADGEPEQQLDAAIRASRRAAPLTEVIVWAPKGKVGIVRHALKSGAEDVILGRKPEALAEAVKEVIEQQKLLPRLQLLERARSRSSRFEGLVSRSGAMWDVFETCLRVAPTDATVLVLGETGTGKELLAQAIHSQSKRKGRFVAINCGAVPETLIDSELFGHEKGSFTGAAESKPGLFRHADEGTLFLDEIGNIPVSAQFSLLRALQEGSVRPVGASEEIAVDVRVVAATSLPLEEAVREGKFREDLLYRLDVIRVVVPPLRERPEDIAFLYGHFRNKLSRHHGLSPPAHSDGFVKALLEYEWPGNVRELENFTERLILTHRSGRLGARHFARLTRSYRGKDAPPASDAHRSGRQPIVGRPDPAAPTPASPRAGAPAAHAPDVDLSRTLDECLEPVIDDLERRYLEAALVHNRGRIQATADTAGLSRRTLLRKLNKYELDKADFK